MAPCELVIVCLLERMPTGMAVSMSVLGLSPVFLSGDAVTAAAVDYGMLLAARVVAGAVQGLVIGGVASAVGGGLVSPERRGRRPNAFWQWAAAHAASP